MMTLIAWVQPGISGRRGPGRRARAPGKNWISGNRGSRGRKLLQIL